MKTTVTHKKRAKRNKTIAKKKNVRVRRNSKKIDGKQSGLIRKILLLIILGSAFFYAKDHGYFEKLKTRYFEMSEAKTIQNKKNKTTTIDKKLLKEKNTNEDNKLIALVSLDKLYGVNIKQQLIEIKKNLAIDLPIITGIDKKAYVLGDSLHELSFTLKLLNDTQETFKKASEKISEIKVVGEKSAVISFVNSKIRAQVNEFKLKQQLNNLSTLLNYNNLKTNNIINMKFENMAFLKEEK